MTQVASSGLLPLDELNVFWRSDGEFAPSLISDLSHTGAFIKTSNPAVVGAVLQVRLDAPRREICAEAVVRRVEPGQGMAVEFESMTEDDRARLHAWIRQLETAQVSPVAAPASPAPAAPAAPSAPVPAQPPRTSALSTKPAEVAAPDPARPRNRGIDRRSRVRHKFTAPVQVTESGSARPIPAQLADLGRGGCYLSLETPLPLGTSVEISITENEQSFQAHANVVSAQPGKGMGLAFTAIDPAQLIVLDGWLATSSERHWLASSRRRSQRVMVSIPVRVATKNHAGLEVLEDTKTVSISPHGALVKLEMAVTKGQTVVLRDPSTDKALEGSVVYLGNVEGRRREVGISFVLPNRTLWRIAFPPADWSPHHPDAKG